MSMTVVEAQTHLDAWIAADLAISRGKSYAIGDRQLTRQDAAEVGNRISYWQRTVNALKAEAAGNSNPTIKVATWR